VSGGHNMSRGDRSVPQQMGECEVLDIQAVADLLDCELKTVQARALAGYLPGLKIGRSWVFPLAALHQRLNELALAEAAERRAGKTPSPAAEAFAPVRDRGRRNQLPACLRNVPGE